MDRTVPAGAVHGVTDEMTKQGAPTLRYEIGNQLAADPDVLAVATVVASAAVGAVTEGFYLLARRFGWSK